MSGPGPIRGEMLYDRVFGQLLLGLISTRLVAAGWKVGKSQTRSLRPAGTVDGICLRARPATVPKYDQGTATATAAAMRVELVQVVAVVAAARSIGVGVDHTEHISSCYPVLCYPFHAHAPTTRRPPVPDRLMIQHGQRQGLTRTQQATAAGRGAARLTRCDVTIRGPCLSPCPLVLVEQRLLLTTTMVHGSFGHRARYSHTPPI